MTILSGSSESVRTPEGARATFARILSHWAVDLMRLRRQGLDIPLYPSTRRVETTSHPGHSPDAGPRRSHT